MGTQLRDRQEEWPRVGVAVTRERVFPSPRAEARARRRPDLRRQARPVFVDDSGRRRRAARAVGTSVGVLALGYVLFVGLALAGIPGLGEVGAPGLGSLTRPAGEQADVGPDPVEQAVPAEVAQPESEAPPSAPTTSETAPQAGPTSAPESSTTTSSTTMPPVTTTTTVLHGDGPGAAVPGPNSTVPEKGGPPTSRPGGQ